MGLELWATWQSLTRILLSEGLPTDRFGSEKKERRRVKVLIPGFGMCQLMARALAHVCV